MIVYRLKFDTYNSERRKALIQEYFNGQPKKPPESVLVTKQEFEKATSVIYFPWKDKIDINVRENYWKQHHNFQPDIWQIIPLFRNTYSYMEFTYEEKLHWPDEIIDSIFQQRDFNEKPVVCLLAATASGKTSAIFRTLSKQFGLFFCCDVNVSPVDCNLFTKDLLMRYFVIVSLIVLLRKLWVLVSTLDFWFSFLLFFLCLCVILKIFSRINF